MFYGLFLALVVYRSISLKQLLRIFRTTIELSGIILLVIGMAAMLEAPLVCVDVQRGGPATGIPTKTEQGDLWQVLGAGQGDYPRIIVAPLSIPDCCPTVQEAFNLVDRYQCPVIVLSDLLISEGNETVDPVGIEPLIGALVRSRFKKAEIVVV